MCDPTEEDSATIAVDKLAVSVGATGGVVIETDVLLKNAASEVVAPDGKLACKISSCSNSCLESLLCPEKGANHVDAAKVSDPVVVTSMEPVDGIASVG